MRNGLYLSYLGLAALALSASLSLVLAQNTDLHDKIVACYVGTWAFYRTGDGKYDIDNIDPYLCTHGFYGFADLDNSTWEIKVYDPWFDLAPGDCEPGYCNYDSYRRFVALKQINPSFVPMLSIGGWNAGSEKYSQMALDPAKREIFVRTTVELLLEYGFEGVDIDWEYPGAREGADPEHDREDFTYLIEEFKVALAPYGLLLTAAVTPDPTRADVAYEFEKLDQLFDFWNIMCYDYHGWFPDHEFTGHNAPLYKRAEEDYEGHPGYKFNIFDTVSHYINRGVKPENIVMGMPTYGRGFKLNFTEQTGLYCPAEAGIPMGPYTSQDGIWGYLEVLQALNNQTLINLPDAVPQSWTIVRDDCLQAPYAFNGPYWIGYDDPDSIKIKVDFINFMKLKGAMIWSLDTDDFNGLFGEAYPILKRINLELSNQNEYDPESPVCSGTAPMCDLFDGFATTTMAPTTTGTPTMFPATTDPLGILCTYHGENVAYPGDCHKYIRCAEDPPNSGLFTTSVYTCGDYAFNPYDISCVDPCLPANANLCQDTIGCDRWV